MKFLVRIISIFLILAITLTLIMRKNRFYEIQNKSNGTIVYFTLIDRHWSYFDTHYYLVPGRYSKQTMPNSNFATLKINGGWIPENILCIQNPINEKTPIRLVYYYGFEKNSFENNIEVVDDYYSLLKNSELDTSFTCHELFSVVHSIVD